MVAKFFRIDKDTDLDLTENDISDRISDIASSYLSENEHLELKFITQSEDNECFTIVLWFIDK